MCVHAYVCEDFPSEWKQEKKQHCENILELLKKISLYNMSESSLFKITLIEQNTRVNGKPDEPFARV